jgi:DNA-binding FadR family transcriptional regulator
MKKYSSNPESYEFMRYLVEASLNDSQCDRLPSLAELSKELDMSVARLREQLEMAKALGLVEVHPRTGIRPIPYSFLPAVRNSLWYALETNRLNFDAYSDFRNHIEEAYWFEAVAMLTDEDHAELKALVDSAWKKLRNPQVVIPHSEHRGIHMGIFRRLDNLFVLGVLEAYWEAYEAVGLNLYTEYDYLERVWQYHEQMVEAILQGDYHAGYRALVDHKDLLYHRPVASLITNKDCDDN